MSVTVHIAIPIGRLTLRRSIITSLTIISREDKGDKPIGQKLRILEAYRKDNQ